MDFTSSTLSSLTVNNSFATAPQVSASGPITLGGALALTAGTLAMGANGLTVAGNISRTAGLITSTGIVTLNGSAAQTVDFTSSTLANLTVDNSFATAPQVSATQLTSLPGNLTLTAGTLSIGATGLSIGGNVTRTSGALSSTGTVTLNGSAAQTVDVTSSTLTSLAVDNSFATAPQVSASAPITLGGALALTTGTLAMGANGLTVAGNISRTSGLITSTGTVTLNGSAAQTLDFTSSTLANLTVNNSFGTAPQVSASAPSPWVALSP